MEDVQVDVEAAVYIEVEANVEVEVGRRSKQALKQHGTEEVEAVKQASK